METFIVRPFGEKNGVNFDLVEERLIIPALKKAGIKGYTTGAILEAGNIRQDMFQFLLTSDLVIADISVHNANVFYELGIRHALRSAKTVLIRCRKDVVPFDLKTDRYLSYDQLDPAAEVDRLCTSLKQTIDSKRIDSPVFSMLPKLKSQNPEHFLAVPGDFSYEVNLAKAAGKQGKLALLAKEAQFFSWELPALRMIGESLYRSGYYEIAQEIWERVVKKKPTDIEANGYLATIYQRLAEKKARRNNEMAKQLLAKSEEAINCLFEQFENLNRYKRAEAFSLRARNAKAKWVRKWVDLELEKMQKEAIKSNLLLEAYENYSMGFYEDLNHFYSGVNALALLKITIELAERECVVWESKFDTVREAGNALTTYKEEFDELALVVRKVVESKKKVLQRTEKIDPWINMTLADIALLTSDNPIRVANLHSSVVESGAGLNFDAPLRQLRMYEKLDLMTENVEAALKEFESFGKGNDEDCRVLLFTGHMIDKNDRNMQRFPEEKEQGIREKIKEKVTEILKAAPSPNQLIGIAGGACGGDILFHEVCKELGIKTEMFLALPHEGYIVGSVKFAGNTWVKRFYTIYDDTNVIVHRLSEEKELPTWLRSKAGYTFWERNNLWILNSAFIHGSQNLTFLALWDGKKGDGPGGTQHMIEQVKKRGAKSIVIPMK